MASVNILSESGDGYILGSASAYADARSTSGSSNTTGAEIIFGQRLSGATYSVWRGYLRFNTSTIPDDAIITSVRLYLKSSADNSTVDFNIKIYRYAWQSPLATYREANFDGA